MGILKNLAVFVTLALSACVNNSLYESGHQSGYGYTETEIGENQYEVEFVMRGDHISYAYEHALLRAAELCLQKRHNRTEKIYSAQETYQGLYDKLVVQKTIF